MPDPTYTVTGFAEELLRLSREYVAHFDPGAETSVSAVRLEASGPHLHLIFDQRGDEGPNLTVELRGVATGLELAPLPPHGEAEGARAWFR